MPTVDLVVQNDVERTIRVRQLEAMFDVPAEKKTTLRWRGELPLDARPWSVGLIVGPSGSGKSTIARSLWGEPSVLTWSGRAVVDDFAETLSMEEIAGVCQAVGFNTIPAWMRPYGALSTGERFRVEIARRMLEAEGLIVLDEFTSVVDRQVAKIGAHAVQKYVRKRGLRLVAVTCHYDVLDWLQPDWVLEPATMSFQWRELQRRPSVAVEIARIPSVAWRLFAPFHYMSAELNRAAKCFGLWADGTLAAFAAILFRPHPKVRDIYGVSRVVTLPDWQGLGLAFVLVDTIASAYVALGRRFHHYPAHPSFVRALDRSKSWALMKRPGTYSRRAGNSSTARMGGRPCAVFRYCGPAMDAAEARRLVA